MLRLFWHQFLNRTRSVWWLLLVQKSIRKDCKLASLSGELLKFAAEKAAGGRIWRKLGDAMQASCRKRWKVLGICWLKGWVNLGFCVGTRQCRVILRVNLTSNPQSGRG